METINVLEIFNSIEGETKRSGELVTFVRLSGCNLKCSYCDTNYSQKCNQGTKMTLIDLRNELDKYNCKKLTFTGGEPLLKAHSKTVVNFINILANDGYKINIETNGSIIPDKSLMYNDNIFFSMDYKSPSSNMNKKMISSYDMSECLSGNDCLKFVVSNLEDLEYAKKRIKEIEEHYNLNGDNQLESGRVTYYFSPCYGQIEMKDIVEFMKENNLTERVKLQIQLHKVIWDVNERCV